MTDNVLLIAVADIQAHCAGAMDLETRVARAFAQARRFWASGDNDLRFRAALAAAMLETSDPDEKLRIELSSALLFWFNEQVEGRDPPYPEVPDGFVSLPLMKLWQESATPPLTQG